MFHRVVTELLYEWAKAHRSDVGEIRMVGDRHFQRSHKLRDLLGRNRILNRFYEADSEEGRALLTRAGQTSARLPVVVLLDERVLGSPRRKLFASGPLRNLWFRPDGPGSFSELLTLP
jgi:thioredoxin reductase (NADPH)